MLAFTGMDRGHGNRCGGGSGWWLVCECVCVCGSEEEGRGGGVKAGNECDLEKVAQRGKGEMIVAAVEPTEKQINKKNGRKA